MQLADFKAPAQQQTDTTPGASPMPAPPDGSYGNLFDRLGTTMMSPLFQMGAGVADAGWRGQGFGAGIMQGAQQASVMQKAMAEQQARERQMAQQAKQDEFMRGLAGGNRPAWTNELPSGVVDAAVALNDPSMIAAGIGKNSTDDIKEYQFAKRDGFKGGFDAWMRAKKAQGLGRTPIFGTGPNGETTVLQLGEGELAPAKMPPGFTVDPRNVAKIDTGTGTALLGNDGRVIANVNKDIAGKERQEAIGKAEGQGAIGLPKAQAALKQYEIQNDIVSQEIDKALKEINWTTTGFVGSGAKYVPGTQAHGLARLIDTIKGNIGFDKLQAMRENSPTGGALGSISDFENKMLQSVLGSLEQSQDGASLRANLERLKGVLSQFREMRQKAYETDVARYGNFAPPGQHAAPQGTGQGQPNAGFSARKLD
jgi:hypothetical protein